LSTLMISSLSHEASTFVYNLMAMTHRVVQSVGVDETVVHLVTSLWELSVNTLSKSSFSTKTRIARFFWRHDANCLWKVVQFAQLTFLIYSLQISMGFASWQHYCMALQWWASAKLCGVEQRAPPVFGRAAITLGIGPHFWSSFSLLL